MPGPQPDAISLLRSIRRGGIHPSRALPAAANGHGGQGAGRPTAPLKNPCVGRGALTSPKLTAISHFPLKSKYKEKSTTSNEVVLLGDPCGNRTHVNGVRGRCLNRLTNGPYKRSRHLPIFTGRFQPTIFGTSELNFCVRNGNRWNLTVIDTGHFHDLISCFSFFL